ncbi:PAS domain S-box protein [Prosthecobacter sp.]|uniref:PAS domain S-box protein n=1 Tax=Prosthecobacter sp. TaxID=1965333 RepID=UPI0037847FC6
MKKLPCAAPALPRKAAARSATGPPPQAPKPESAALEMLVASTTRLWQMQDLHEGLEEILGSAIALLGADFGNVQLFDPAAQMLRIAVHRGFKRPFLEFFQEVSTREGSACGRALRSGRRIIIEDVEKDPGYRHCRTVARAAGYRSVQSTPLFHSDGTPLGMISTHFRKVHRPDGLELARLDLYMQMAVSFIGRCRAEEALRESERRYRLLADNTADFVALSDVKGKILYLSPSYERRLGISVSLLNGRGAAPYMHPDDLKAIRQARAANLAGTSTTIEYRFLKKPDTWLWMEGHCTPICGPKGQVASLLLVSREVTARKQAELARRESEERYRQLVQSLPAAIYTCDVSGRITLYNAEAVKLWGREPDARDRWDASHRILDAEGRPLKRSQLAIVEAVRSGEPLRGMERIVERADGSRSHVLCFPDPVLDANLRIVGAVSMLVDITPLKDTQSKLRAALGELQTLSHAVKQSPAAVIITSAEGAIEFVNPKFTSVTGYTAAEVLGQNPRLLKSGEQPQSFYKAMWETLSAGKEWRGEFCNRKKSGELFWEYAVIAPIMGDNGRIRHFLAIKEDITEHRRAVTMLREREERLCAILNTVADAIITIDQHGTIIAVNPATERMFGYPVQELVGQNVKMLMPSPYHAEHASYIRNFHRGGRPGLIGIGREVQARRKDGSIFPIELAVSEVDHLNLYTGVIRDITSRRALEKEILDVSESERAAIGEDLHDDLGQQLAGLWCISKGLHDSLKKRDAPEAGEAAKMSDVLRQVLALTRSLAQGLHPVALETGGLVAALKALAARTRLMFGVPCRFYGLNRDIGLDQTTTTHLFRICQEAVTNAARHAQAARIDIRLSTRKGQVLLSVRDDGCGIPEVSSYTRGMGLRIMHHRASLIGADFKIEHAPHGGTLMTCKVQTHTPSPAP